MYRKHYVQTSAQARAYCPPVTTRTSASLASGLEYAALCSSCLPPGRSALRATIPFDLTGSPAISVPFRWSAEGLPIGVQLVGRHFGEPTLLRAAAALESAREDPQRRPPV